MMSSKETNGVCIFYFMYLLRFILVYISTEISRVSPFNMGILLRNFNTFQYISASVDIRPHPGAWIAELLGVVLGIQDHKKIKFPMVSILAIGT